MPVGFSTIEKKDLRTTIGVSSDNFILLYLGSIGTWYQWGEMVSFLKS